jgi:hypothetical protein
LLSPAVLLVKHLSLRNANPNSNYNAVVGSLYSQHSGQLRSKSFTSDSRYRTTLAQLHTYTSFDDSTAGPEARRQQELHFRSSRSKCFVQLKHGAPTKPPRSPRIKLPRYTNRRRARTPQTPPTRHCTQMHDTNSISRISADLVPNLKPRRSPSPSRAHDRPSGSRHRHHHRNHHRDSSSPSLLSGSDSATPPRSAKKYRRRRSDAEPDHTFRGRARKFSRSRSRIAEGQGEDQEEEYQEKRRKRSPPPSRHRSESAVDARRQRSLPNTYGNKGKRGGDGGELGDGRDEERAVAIA